jgi:hypothetical protein
MDMKYKVLLILGVVLSMICCEKVNNNDYESTGKILGPDYRMCICCGGWQILIDSVTYNFDSIPVNSNINLEKETFPLLVKLDWQLTNNGGCPKWITIQRIAKE